MIKGVKQFVVRGNVIDLAVAVAVGTALAALVAAVTQSLIEPIVGWMLSLIGGIRRHGRRHHHDRTGL